MKSRETHVGKRRANGPHLSKEMDCLYMPRFGYGFSWLIGSENDEQFQLFGQRRGESSSTPHSRSNR